jgi:hypothetical protein
MHYYAEDESAFVEERRAARVKRRGEGDIASPVSPGGKKKKIRGKIGKI